MESDALNGPPVYAFKSKFLKMLAASAGSDEGGEGPVTEVVSALPAVETGSSGGGEAREGAKCGEGGRNIVGREVCSDLNIRRYGEVTS